MVFLAARYGLCRFEKWNTIFCFAPLLGSLPGFPFGHVFGSNHNANGFPGKLKKLSLYNFVRLAMTFRIKLQLLSAVLLTVISTSGCTVDMSRRANRQTGMASASVGLSNPRLQLNEPRAVTRKLTTSDSIVAQAPAVIAKRDIVRNPYTPTAGKPQQEKPLRIGEATPSQSSRRNDGVSVVSHSEPATEIAESDSIISPVGENTSPAGTMTLAQFEELALRNNPTIGQASADISKASALRDQVGRYPNPILGYFGSQIGDAGTDQHGVFVEQEIVRRGKLPLNQQIMRHAIDAQSAAAESQALRVLTDVRTRYIVALAAQAQVKLTREFGVVATQGVEIASRRKDAQEGSQPELLQAEIQLSEIELTHEQAGVAFASAFRDLAAVAGATDLQPISLEGELSQPSQPFDWEHVYADLLATSPELQTAQARLQKACAQLQRERIQALPNPTLQLGGGVDNGTGSGLLNVQVSAPIPVFNSNRGNISAAQADYDKAAQEITRTELAIKSRLALVSREYDSALAAVRRYQSEILPKSKNSLELTETLYRAGEIDFLQVFLVRKTYFESNLRFVQSLSELAQSRARIQGMLLEGGLVPLNPLEADDGNRERVFSQR